MGFLCGNCWNFNPCCLRLANLVWTQFLKNDRSSDIGQLSDFNFTRKAALNPLRPQLLSLTIIVPDVMTIPDNVWRSKRQKRTYWQSIFYVNP
nr:PREDICTED: uncharacterized protein LOC105663183 isoform X3 [Megachile rotundata]